MAQLECISLLFHLHASSVREMSPREFYTILQVKFIIIFENHSIIGIIPDSFHYLLLKLFWYILWVLIEMPFAFL